MDPESLGTKTNNAPRKVKFAPKAPVRRPQKLVVPKPEKVEDAESDAAKAQELFLRFNEASMRPKAKVEKKAPSVRVAFGYGGTSTSIRSYSPSGGINRSSDAVGLGQKIEKEYKEPWDYYTYYPLTLPLRRPYSGNPELLDDEEFGETSEGMTYDECSLNSGTELGLMEENPETSMFFFQLPATMPMMKQSTKTESQEMPSSSKPPEGTPTLEKGCALNDLPAGFMGKMLVYRSGAVKLKLGDTIYDVSTGLDSIFAQDVVAINPDEKHCCLVGELGKRAIITPDIDSVLDSVHNL